MNIPESIRREVTQDEIDTIIRELDELPHEHYFCSVCKQEVWLNRPYDGHVIVCMDCLD